MKSKVGTSKSGLPCLSHSAGLLLLTTALIVTQVSGAQATAERTLESLSINGETYSHVKVIRQTPTDILFRHDGGITGIKVHYLDNPSLRRLGYEIEVAAPKASDLASERFESLPVLVPPGDVRWVLLLLFVGGCSLLLGACLYISYVFRLICLKTGTEPGFTVWLPFLQAFPLLRAARMSWAWLVALVSLSVLLAYAAFRVPEHSIVFGSLLIAAFVTLAIVWSVRICHACGKNALFAIFLLLPGLNCLALIHLAGSK